MDPFVGKLGLFRVHQGTIRAGAQLFVGDGRKPVKIAHLFRMQGKEHAEVPLAVPGDICAVAKLDELHFDAVLHDSHDEDHFHLKPMVYPPAMLGVAIEPERRGDEHKLAEALHKLVAEDPCVRVEHHSGLNETVLYGMGDLHLRVMMERMTERYGVPVKTRPPSIPYRETITRPAEGHHRHKKQTGGAGQFGEVYLRIEPLARGSGFEFVDDVVGGVDPEPVHPGGREGHPPRAGRGRRRGLPAAGYPRLGLRRQVPFGGLEGSRLRLRRPQGLPRCRAEGLAGRARADRARQDQRAGHGHGRHHGGPRDAACAHRRQRSARAGPDRGISLRAARGSHRLPEPVEGTHRRRREFYLAAQPLRPGPAAQAAGTRIRLEARGGRGMSANARSDTRIMAVFCDFENVALGVRDVKIASFDIRKVLERLLLKGNIVVKKAYCNWERYQDYKRPMHEAAFELIEIPHVRQSGKNSADIRMVVDALDLCYTKAHVDTFVIISGDSDFSPLVAKLRENNKFVIGCGVKHSTSDLLISGCDEFIYYDDLVRGEGRAKVARKEKVAKSAPKAPPGADDRRQEGIELMMETAEDLFAERDAEEKVWGSMVKQAIKRRKPGFNESYYGFRTFGNMLEEARDRKLIGLEFDPKSGGYIITRVAAA